MSQDRFVLLGPGEVRPGRVTLPPAFAVKAMTGDTEGRFSLLEVTLAKDIPRHTHHEADECIYVLEGELGIDFDDQTHVAGKGAFVILPHGVPHALRAVSTPPPRLLQISSPGGWEHYVEDLIEAGPAVLTNGSLDPVKINPIAARHAITYEV
ncbi:cupin domain-containing protein [Saccharothrix variisporea]|uniref:Cupin domain n=1 Tax=Saccharothrix variisporea TaxID=543527 RepID=A0A495XFV1_9PSEU|nr:cupin domain-containing protein [Saccharothrix variisporea]RKT72569.1 cupin domain [Saccharothrix variisporea]